MKLDAAGATLDDIIFRVLSPCQGRIPVSPSRHSRPGWLRVVLHDPVDEQTARHRDEEGQLGNQLNRRMPTWQDARSRHAGQYEPAGVHDRRRHGAYGCEIAKLTLYLVEAGAQNRRYL
jgi:hypothetical protein